MRRHFFGREFIAALLAILAACVVVGGTLGAASLVRAGIEQARTESATGNTAQLTPIVAHGQKLFAVNCSHCHADDATGDEGPDLHGLTKSDERIKRMITHSINGTTPLFTMTLHHTAHSH